MKSILSKASLFLIAAWAAFPLQSFTNAGGDVFEVYIGKEMVLQQALHGKPAIREISIRPEQRDEKISIRFYHCGKVGTKRAITFRDANDKTLKVLQFSEAKTDNSVMAFPVSEITSFQSEENMKLRIYYSSAELPEGKWLCSIAR